MRDLPEKPYHRRTIYIYKKYQRNFIIKFCLIALGAMTAASLSLYYFSRNTLTATYGHHHLALRSTAEAILPALITTNLFVLICVLVATVVVTLYVSHKIGGPLYRLGKSLESFGEGNLKLRICLRREDQIKDLAGQFNKMAENLDGKIRQVKDAVTELGQKIQTTNWDKGTVKEDVERLQQIFSQLFKTE